MSISKVTEKIKSNMEIIKKNHFANELQLDKNEWTNLMTHKFIEELYINGNAYNDQLKGKNREGIMKMIIESKLPNTPIVWYDDGVDIINRIYNSTSSQKSSEKSNYKLVGLLIFLIILIISLIIYFLSRKKK